MVPVKESRSIYEKAGEPKKLVVVPSLRQHKLCYEPGFACMMAASTEAVCPAPVKRMEVPAVANN